MIGRRRHRRPWSLTYRLTLGYSIWFALSFATMMILAFLFAVQIPKWQVERQVRAEAEAFARYYGPAHRVPHFIAMLKARAVQPTDRQAYYALWSPADTMLASNLPSNFQRLRGGPLLRFEFNTYDDGVEVEREAIAYVKKLPDGSRLLVGRDSQDIDDLEELLLHALIWCTGVAVALGILGGMVVSRSVGRRIDAVASTADRVMAGDLSERIEIEGSGDDFDHLATTLNAMLDRIQDLLQSVSRVSDSIAHELRTPLTRLGADLEDMRSAQDTDVRERLVEQAIDSSMRLQATFDALLRIARIETRRQPLLKQEADLGALLVDAIELYEPAALDKGVTLNRTIEAGLVLSCERNLLFQVFANLLDNAIKYVPADGAIDIVGQRQADGLVVIISDNGPGVPPEEHSRLTERFYRATGSGPRQGLGLGLTLAQAILRHHDTKLAFQDNHPGLQVRIYFPILS